MMVGHGVLETVAGSIVLGVLFKTGAVIWSFLYLQGKLSNPKIPEILKLGTQVV